MSLDLLWGFLLGVGAMVATTAAWAGLREWRNYRAFLRHARVLRAHGYQAQLYLPHVGVDDRALAAAMRFFTAHQHVIVAADRPPRPQLRLVASSSAPRQPSVTGTVHSATALPSS